MTKFVLLLTAGIAIRCNDGVRGGSEAESESEAEGESEAEAEAESEAESEAEGESEAESESESEIKASCTAWCGQFAECHPGWAYECMDECLCLGEISAAEWLSRLAECAEIGCGGAFDTCLPGYDCPSEADTFRVDCIYRNSECELEGLADACYLSCRLDVASLSALMDCYEMDCSSIAPCVTDIFYCYEF